MCPGYLVGAPRLWNATLCRMRAQRDLLRRVSVQRHFWLLAPLALLLSCSGKESGSGVSREESCSVPAPTECPEPPPTYADVRPIFEEACAPCHDPADPAGPWPLDSFEHIVSWRPEVGDELRNCTMPPLDGDPLRPRDRQRLMEWVLCGTPR